MQQRNKYKKYDIVYSIGCDCYCSLYMIKAKLRACSGPFDWITGADCKTRFDFMLNDFKGFLNKSDLKPMPKPTNIPVDENNDYYENVRTGFHFLHDFSVNKIFEEAYSEVREKYDRRIKRFYQNIETKKEYYSFGFLKCITHRMMLF